MAFGTIGIYILLLSVLPKGLKSFLISPVPRNDEAKPFLKLSMATDAVSAHSSNPQNDDPLSSDQEIENYSLQLAFQPPQMLRELKLGEQLHLPSTPLEIIRVSVVPDIFVFRNFLPYDQDRQALMQEAIASGLEDAETKSGHVLHRSQSSVAWIHVVVDETELTTTTAGQQIASFMTDTVPQIFLSETLLESNRFDPETLQVAHYTKGGKFDLHHDGFGRVVTVLTYLNGVAGTWFPFAKLSEITAADKEECPPQMTLEGTRMTEGKVPGKHGIWVVGDEFEGDPPTDPHIVKVCAGDAVVFYNYELDVGYGGAPTMAWRSLHAGMPASREKWIATNWIHTDFVD